MIEINAIDVLSWGVVTAGACVVLLVVGMLVHDLWQMVLSYRNTRRPSPVVLHVPEYEDQRFTVYRETGNDEAA